MSRESATPVDSTDRGVAVDVNLYGRALDRTHEVFANLKPDQMSDPTPCTDWDVRALANHIVGGNWMFAAAAQGEAPSGDPGADLVGHDPLAAYDTSAAATRAAWSAPGVLEKTVTLPIGEMPGLMALSIAFLDNLVHGWDLAKATGQDTELGDDLATVGLEVARAVAPGGRGHFFGDEIPVADDAPPQSRLLGFLGRQP